MVITDFFLRQAVSPSLISEADGQAVLAAVQALVPPILDGLSVVATKKSALENFPLIPVGSMILGDLQSLDSATSDFENALIAAAPVRFSAHIKSPVSA